MRVCVCWKVTWLRSRELWESCTCVEGEVWGISCLLPPQTQLCIDLEGLLRGRARGEVRAVLNRYSYWGKLCYVADRCCRAGLC